MASLRFEWDEAKNVANQRKHGISFEQAIEVFDDPLYVQALERIENGEERWQTFGLIGGILFLVVHTIEEEREGNEWIELIRVVSVRYAIPWERRRYELENS